jgi:hypothetical protein
MHACIVRSTDDDNNDTCNAPTTFNHASNANNITDTSIVLVTFPLLNIRNQLWLKCIIIFDQRLPYTMV